MPGRGGVRGTAAAVPAYIFRDIFSKHRRSLTAYLCNREDTLLEAINLAGQAALVTGASSGIGRAFALCLARAASKGGVLLLAQSLAQEFTPRRIRVNVVAPGAIRTDITRAAWTTEAGRSDLLRLIPYGRIGDGQDVARAVAWLCSDLSDYVTGATLAVDGGMLLYPGFQAGHG